MIKLASKRGSVREIKSDLVALLVFGDKENFAKQTASLEESASLPDAPLRSGAFTAAEGQTLLLYPRKLKTPQLLLVGVGPADELTLERLRRAAGKATICASGVHAATLAIVEPDPALIGKAVFESDDDPWKNIGLALAEGAALAAYRYDKYISQKKQGSRTLKVITIVSGTEPRRRRIEEGVSLARVLCNATYRARDLQNAPGNELYPETLARDAQKAGRQHGIRVSVFDERRIARLRMGGLLGVARGSAQPPRFIVMELNREKAPRGTVVLVGKGVTFDSGGISIKPAANMAEMKMDMSGAAAVIGAMQAAADLRIPLHLVGLIPATENLPGGKALKPGDILTHHNGVTSEIDNTDAEGRLILADALSYASRYKPDLVIDLATLTGAVVVALGHVTTGMMGNDTATMQQMREAGLRTFERVWELPLYQEYERLVKSDVADVKNVGGRWAGAITGALFLKKFVKDYRWIHLDIAGTATLEEPFEYIPKGGSGVGVRLLTDFLMHWKKPRGPKPGR